MVTLSVAIGRRAGDQFAPSSQESPSAPVQTISAPGWIVEKDQFTLFPPSSGGTIPAVNSDDGAGAVEGSKGLMGLLYDYVARISRGHVWITGDDLETPDEDCEHIVVSYFPDEGKVYLLNIDFQNHRKCVLHQFGDKDFLELEPGEFRVVESVVLEPFEKQNAE